MASTRHANPTIVKQGRDAPALLSFPQERMFLLDRIMPGLSAYNVPTVVRTAAPLDAELLRQACETVVARHEILRTAIRLADGTPVQEVMPPAPFELTVLDLSTEPEPREAKALELLRDLAVRPFELAGDVLLRAALVHLGDHDLVLVVLHHIASDHASRTLLFNELDALYAAGRDGTEPELPELPVQYADFAQWQRERFSGPRLERLLEYWTGHLAGAPERLELPADRPRPSVQSYHARLREFTLPAPLVAPLRELARRERSTLFMVLLAGFKALLYRYTGADDVVVGTPVSGRRYPEISKLIGYFSNTLALRTDASGDPSFSELVGRVKTAAVQAQVHQELPFEKLVEVLNPERTASHSPIFQVLFGFDVADEQPLALAGEPVEVVSLPGLRNARQDFSLALRQLPDGSIHGRIAYATDLFETATIERLIGHFQTLLSAAGADPGLRLSELGLLTPPERHSMLVEWNATARGYDERCLHELISEQASRTPDAVAVVAAEGRCTYGELDERSNQLARELGAMDVGPGTVVGICAERGIEMMVALLGTMKSGAAYVPIDPGYPPGRQELMLADSGARVLLTQQRFLGTLDPGEAVTLCLDRDWARVAQRSAEPVPAGSTVDQLAYVIYTSGSTGRPKGVEISHRALVNFLAAMRERPGIDAHDVLLAVTTLSFDIAGLELYLPLLVGARVVITPLEATMDGLQLADWLARSGATFMQATPTTWQLLVDAGWTGNATLKLACGGEALPRALADQLLDRCGSLWQMYGPTETTIWSSVLQLARDDEAPRLGGPIANTVFYVLDERRQPVPVGVAGELYIGGDGVAEGYRNQPELTAERFVADPFAPAGGRIYRTGDLVRWRADGTLDFLGRLDHQVKLRGFRIELEEIEAALAAQDGVTTAVVIVREDVPGDKRLVAYFVAREGATPEIDRMRTGLRARLPPYMVPSAFVAMASMPTTPNGKLDRKALPAPDGATRELERERDYVAPATPVEEALTEIWSQVLVVDRVGIDDDFFDLGGHSLLAVKMVAQVFDDLGVELPLRRLFETPRIRELAAGITEQMLGDADDDELASLLTELEGS